MRLLRVGGGKRSGLLWRVTKSMFWIVLVVYIVILALPHAPHSTSATPFLAADPNSLEMMFVHIMRAWIGPIAVIVGAVWLLIVLVRRMIWGPKVA